MGGWDQNNLKYIRRISAETRELNFTTEWDMWKVSTASSKDGSKTKSNMVRVKLLIISCSGFSGFCTLGVFSLHWAALQNPFWEPKPLEKMSGYCYWGVPWSRFSGQRFYAQAHTSRSTSPASIDGTAVNRLAQAMALESEYQPYSWHLQNQCSGHLAAGNT